MFADSLFHGHNEMTMKHLREIAAGRFKSECLALLDRVAETGESLVVTKRGRPVARIMPIEQPGVRSLRGSVEVLGDLLAPIDADWHAAR